jgi:hypothetical protein
MRVLPLICILFFSTVLSALPIESLVLPGQVSTLPVSVQLDREIVDGYTVQKYVVSARDFLIFSGFNSMWNLPLIANESAVRFHLGRQRNIGGELRLYPKEGVAEAGWVAILPAALKAAQENQANEAVRFKVDEDDSIQFLLPVESRGRTILDEKGNVIFSDKREVYPTIWGHRYYVVEYEVTLNPDTEDAIEMTVNELFWMTETADVHVIFQAPTEYHAGLYQSFLSFLKEFYTLME